MKATILASLVTLVALSGCTGSEKGTVGIAVTDAPVDDYTSVMVTFSRAAIHRSQGADANATTGWITIVDTTHTVDLLALHRNNTAQTLGFAELDAGKYQQLRIYVDRVEATKRSDGSTVTMTVPSGAIKTSGNFEVKPGGNTTLTLEFDLNKSINCNNQGCKFQPHIGRVEAKDN